MNGNLLDGKRQNRRIVFWELPRPALTDRESSCRCQLLEFHACSADNRDNKEELNWEIPTQTSFERQH